VKSLSIIFLLVFLIPVVAGAVETRDASSTPSKETGEISHSVSGKSSAAYFEFNCTEGDMPFIVEITDPAKIEHARKVIAGVEKKGTLITGTISPESRWYNPNWSFHIIPSSLSFTERSIEVCSAAPEYVEGHLSEVGGAFLPNRHWCPWCGKLKKEITENVNNSDQAR
jgi:hypothetical protein